MKETSKIMSLSFFPEKRVNIENKLRE